jgi:hypothetical protein
MYISFSIDQKINKHLLAEELDLVQQKLELSFIEQINWMSFPYAIENPPAYIVSIPDDVDAPYVQLAVVQIENGLPENEAAFRAVVAAHAPDLSTEEEQQLLSLQQQATQLVNALLMLPDSELQQIKARFDALPPV